MNVVETRDQSHWSLGDLDTRVDAVVLRFAAQACGASQAAVDAQNDWFIVDSSRTIIDASSTRQAARQFVGRPLDALVSGGVSNAFDVVWPAIERGRAQAVWPWIGGSAKVTGRCVELHPIIDTVDGGSTVVGALVVIVESGNDVAIAA